MPWGRIIKALSGFYYVLPENLAYDEKVFIQCRARGVFRKRGLSPLVGDWVCFELSNHHEGTVTEIAERKSGLVRPPIANVELAVLVFSLTEPEFSPLLLDRFLVQTERAGIDAVICLTKADLIQDESLINKIWVEYHRIGYPVVVTSSKQKKGLEELKEKLEDKISVFSGQSGVGKSSLLNVLFPRYDLKTSEISRRLGRGRHTTRHVDLLPLGEHGLVADSPGFSALEFNGIEPEELSYYFLEMRARLDSCRFRGCLHHKEPGCAVRDGVENGEIAQSRYCHYLQFLEEVKEAKQRRY